MEVDSHFCLNAKTKSDLMHIPWFTDCKLKLTICQFGFADIEIYKKPGEEPEQQRLIASVRITSSNEIRRFGEALVKLAEAVSAVEGL